MMLDGILQVTGVVGAWKALWQGWLHTQSCHIPKNHKGMLLHTPVPLHTLVQSLPFPPSSCLHLPGSQLPPLLQCSGQRSSASSEWL